MDTSANHKAVFDKVERGETLIIILGGGGSRNRVFAVKQATKEYRASRTMREEPLRAMRDLMDLRKGPGIASIDEILARREQIRRDAWRP